jgi:nucleotidyltransferase/DNA polymerase involved in DNA repair
MTNENDDQAGPTPRQRKIIHVDMDAFYASVEQRDNPDLRGKPVAVGGSRERGVVAAASYEARKFGVRSAMASVTAKRQCPDLIFVKPRFEVYAAVSQQIREIFAEHTPIIEPLSLDEAYLDVTENLQGIPLARDVALAIRAKIKQETDLNASAGISYNKFLAKLASDHRKPNGQYVITPEMGPAFVETLPVGKFHGIGPATSAKMNALSLQVDHLVLIGEVAVVAPGHDGQRQGALRRHRRFLADRLYRRPQEDHRAGPDHAQRRRTDRSLGRFRTAVGKAPQESTLKTYKDLPHGMPTTHAETVNAELLAFLKG